MWLCPTIVKWMHCCITGIRHATIVPSCTFQVIIQFSSEGTCRICLISQWRRRDNRPSLLLSANPQLKNTTILWSDAATLWSDEPRFVCAHENLPFKIEDDNGYLICAFSVACCMFWKQSCSVLTWLNFSSYRFRVSFAHLSKSSAKKKGRHGPRFVQTLTIANTYYQDRYAKWLDGE